MPHSTDDGSDSATLVLVPGAARPTPEESAPTVVANAISPPGTVDLDVAAFDASDLPERYARRARLGEGGMGEVLLIRDGWIGRDVAMKVVRAGLGSRSDARARFLREARVQGQLEHPSVVPVYDLGRNAKGEVYFTMKRVRGMTLEQIIGGLRRGDALIVSEYSTRQLLGSLSHVCLSIAFAHAHGVVHRDLKPANVMLGNFGEVYVLDWGVAKVTGTSDTAPSPLDPGDATTEAEAKTEAGTIMGTPGYMAPEQVRGESVDTRTDIYALGAILFELLALDPLHRGASYQLLAAPLAEVDARPSRRRTDGDVPPELDAICLRATAFDPNERFASAREMHDAIERYLDGERDVDRRRESARLSVAAAEEFLARAARGGPGAEAERSAALRELGRAVAFDPEHEGALRALTKVLLDAPANLPPEAEAELAEVNRRDRARAAKIAALAYGACGLSASLVLWMGVRSIRWFAALSAMTFFLAAHSWWVGATGNSTPRYMRMVIAFGFIGTSFLSVLFGPLVIVPAVATLQVASFTMNLRANRMTRRAVLASGLLSVLIPFTLQWAGVMPPSYAFEDGRLVVLPIVAGFPPTATLAVLLLAALMGLTFTGVLAGNAVEALAGAERRLFAQAWRLRQLLPDATLASAPSPPRGRAGMPDARVLTK